MPINIFKDNIMLLKESFKERVFSNSFSSAQLAQDIIKHLGLNTLRSRIIAKQGTTIIVTDDRVIRLPHDEMNAKRCRTNRDMLIRLRKTKIAHLTPSFISEGELIGQSYFCETRLPGMGIDIPISRMDEMVDKAAELITNFHEDTAREIIIDESNFEKLFGKYFNALQRTELPCHSERAEGQEFRHSERAEGESRNLKQKLNTIEQSIKAQLIDKKFKTVWMHGDYKIENILFDTKTWQIKGIIDWDLSEAEGLPLLDIFYLLMYKQYTLTKRTVVSIFFERFLPMNFNSDEKKVIDKYLTALKIPDEFIRPMLVMFWIDHITRRYQQQLIDRVSQQDGWMSKNADSVIDEILNSKKPDTFINSMTKRG